MENNYYSKKMKIGFNTFENNVIESDPSYALPSENGKNIDYVVCHFDPNRRNFEDACENAEKAAQRLAEDGVEFIANFEFQNFDAESKSPDGYDWANRPDGTHLLNIPEKYIGALSKAGNLVGLMYDEFEHVIINSNLSITLASKFKKVLPAFPLSKSKDPVEQGELLSRQLGDFFADLKKKGAPALYGEHVFPVLFHKFAENGITPNFKSQKESVSNIQYAVASGAALQYGTELSNCVDLWFRMTNPGHSADEMYNNLVFSYLAGSNRVYVESSHAFVDRREDGAQLNDYGKAFVRFAKEYKGKEREYDVHDLTPEIGIIRYDDTFWGQNDPLVWRKILFGNRRIKPDSRSREYIRVLRILTHGESGKYGLSWDGVYPWSLKAHRSFVSLNSTAVFDGNVRKNTLASLKLCFLCGIHISSETLADVSELVRENGLTAVTPLRFAPDHIRAKAKGRFSEISDGKGKWIVIRSYGSRRLKKSVMPFAGEKGKITLNFSGKTVVLKLDPDGNGFEIEK